jgi:hypothetical protein
MKLRSTSLKNLATQAGPRAPAKEKPVLKLPPLPADGGLDVWITARQACEILGVKRGGVYRLVDATKPFLVSRRPLPKKILISLRSVQALNEATKDPQFWTSPELQSAHQEKLKEMEKP